MYEYICNMFRLKINLPRESTMVAPILLDPNTEAVWPRLEIGLKFRFMIDDQVFYVLALRISSHAAQFFFYFI